MAMGTNIMLNPQKNSKFTNANNVYNALKRAIYKPLACIKEWSEQTEKRH